MAASANPAVNQGQSDVGAVSQALTEETEAGGIAGGSCPFSIFKDVSGPLGKFCGTDGDFQWCEADVTGGVFIDALRIRTMYSHATACTDAGQSTFIVRLGVPNPAGNFYQEEDFFQPAGTWRQWRSIADCDGFFLRTCNNHSIKYEALANGGRVQFGGQWKRWE